MQFGIMQVDYFLWQKFLLDSIIDILFWSTIFSLSVLITAHIRRKKGRGFLTWVWALFKRAHGILLITSAALFLWIGVLVLPESLQFQKKHPNVYIASNIPEFDSQRSAIAAAALYFLIPGFGYLAWRSHLRKADIPETTQARIRLPSWSWFPLAAFLTGEVILAMITISNIDTARYVSLAIWAVLIGLFVFGVVDALRLWRKPRPPDQIRHQ